MIRRGDVDRFVSVTLYPRGNHHFAVALPRYRARLLPTRSSDIIGATFEDYVGWLPNTADLSSWKSNLADRYIVTLGA